MQKPIARNAPELDRLLERFLRRFAFVGPTNIVSFADRFAEFLKATELPRDPVHLLSRMGIRLARAQLDSARAVWAKEGEEYVIYCGRYERPASVSFTLFHEVFEILAHHPRFPTALSDWLEQRLANQFAAALLMPEEAIRHEAARFRTNQECLVPILAERFGVSLSAMRKRLYELRIGNGRPANRTGAPLSR